MASSHLDLVSGLILPSECNIQVKMRILMGTYALSAGYYDAYYKRAQQVA